MVPSKILGSWEFQTFFSLRHFLQSRSWLFFILRFIFREKGREGEREGEKHQSVRETLIGCLLHAPNWGSGLQPRHMPWPGIKLVTFWFTGQCSIHWGTPARPRPRPWLFLFFLCFTCSYPILRLLIEIILGSWENILRHKKIQLPNLLIHWRHFPLSFSHSVLCMHKNILLQHINSLHSLMGIQSSKQFFWYPCFSRTHSSYSWFSYLSLDQILRAEDPSNDFLSSTRAQILRVPEVGILFMLMQDQKVENQRTQTHASKSQVSGKAVAKSKGHFINFYLLLILEAGDSPTFQGLVTLVFKHLRYQSVFD